MTGRNYAEDSGDRSQKVAEGGGRKEEEEELLSSFSNRAEQRGEMAEGKGRFQRRRKLSPDQTK